MSIDCFEELFISEFCDIIIFSCLLYNALLMSVDVLPVYQSCYRKKTVRGFCFFDLVFLINANLLFFYKLQFCAFYHSFPVLTIREVVVLVF